MKIIKLTTLALLTTLAANVASAAPTFYLRGGVGYGSQKAKVESQVPGTTAVPEVGSTDGKPYLGELAFGVKYYFYRGELQYHYSIYDKKAKPIEPTFTMKDHLKSTNNGGFANGFIDIPNSTMVTPYVMAGIGFINSKVKFSDPNTYQSLGKVLSSSKTSTSFAYQFGAGVNVKVQERVDIGLSYRFINKSKNETTGIASAQGAGTVSWNQIVKQQPINAGVIDLTVRF